MRLKLSFLIGAVLLTNTLHAQDVRIGVLGLFHPRHLTLRASSTQAIVIQASGKTFVLERSSGQDAASITSSGENLILQVGSQVVPASALHATSRSGGAADFVLNVPTKITRQYHGVLEIKAVSGTLVPIVGMDLETAVASVVQAESDPDTPLEALKAQAVATRSYFVAARNRHHDFEFCDTTHCQLLREAPPPDSNASRAALITRGLVLAYRDQPIATMFTRSCGGHTRTPQEVGMAHQAYPYFSVICDYCRRNPSRWTRRLSSAEAADVRQRGEAARLDIDRRLGWETVPSNNFILHNNAEGVLLEGVGEGHGIGLCQRGAKAMAQSGAAFHDILEHYYPNTRLTAIGSSSVGGSGQPTGN